MQRNIDHLKKSIQNYLERNELNIDNPSWEIRKSNLGGFGVFASRPIETGEIIFKDCPVILGPRVGLSCPLLCVNCYCKENLKLCEKKCGLQVCSLKCQNSSKHQKECKVVRQWQTELISEDLSEKLVKVLSPIRSLLLSDADKEVVKCLKAHRIEPHGFEVDIMKNILHLNIKEDEEVFMRFVCSVMDANAFEVLVGNEDNQSSVKGLFPLGSLANHSCTPNTIHVFDECQRMVVRAATFIPKDTEIFHSYSRVIWSTPTRRFHLYRTKDFWCRCQRCQDPTEFGTYMSAILCKVCKSGKVIPTDSLRINGKWQCEDCGKITNRKDVAAVTSLLGSALNSFEKDDVDFMLRFLNQKLMNLVPENNETVVELKAKLIWILGHEQNYMWKDLSDELLQTKIKFCNDVLSLLENLHLGQCKMRGLLLYELYYCYLEENKRKTKAGNFSKNHLRNLLLEAADILRYDVTAPAEIKNVQSDDIKLKT